MTTAQVVETSVTDNNNSPIQDYVHPDDQTQPFEMTPGFKPFTVLPLLFFKYNCLYCGMSLVAREEKRLPYLQATLFMILGGIFFKIEGKGFKWQSGFTPVTLTKHLECFLILLFLNIIFISMETCT